MTLYVTFMSFLCSLKKIEEMKKVKKYIIK